MVGDRLRIKKHSQLHSCGRFRKGVGEVLFLINEQKTATVTLVPEKFGSTKKARNLKAEILDVKNRIV